MASAAGSMPFHDFSDGNVELAIQLLNAISALDYKKVEEAFDAIDKCDDREKQLSRIPGHLLLPIDLLMNDGDNQAEKDSILALIIDRYGTGAIYIRFTFLRIPANLYPGLENEEIYPKDIDTQFVKKGLMRVNLLHLFVWHSSARATETYVRQAFLDKLVKKYDIDSETSTGATPLSIAAMYPRPHMFFDLLHYKPNLERVSPYHIFNYEILLKLISLKGADFLFKETCFDAEAPFRVRKTEGVDNALTILILNNDLGIAYDGTLRSPVSIACQVLWLLGLRLPEGYYFTDPVDLKKLELLGSYVETRKDDLRRFLTAHKIDCSKVVATEQSGAAAGGGGSGGCEPGGGSRN